MHPRLGAGIVIPLLAVAAACSEPTSSEETASSSAAIDGATIVSRGMEWVNANLHYCQAAYGAVDWDQACWAWEGASHTCDRQSNAAWNAYRSDCSGFVTYAWGLPPVGDGGYVTGDFAPYRTSFSHTIEGSDLQPGDALNSTPDDHIILFKQWATPGTSAVFMEEPGCSVAIPYAHEFTSNVSISGDQVYVTYEGMTFYAIRFNSSTAPAPPYAASYVSQSFPLATTTLTMKTGEVLPSYIELKNTGSTTWDTKTRIGTTEPRDRTSAFADKTWVAPNRATQVSGTVAPGATYKFTFDLAAPTTPGSYDEHFGVLEEGVAWFGDPGEGGPSDGDLEVKILVVDGDAASPNTDGGTPSPEDSGSVIADDAASSSPLESDGGGESRGGAEGASWGEAPSGTGSGRSGGCSVGTTRSAATPRALCFGLIFLVGVRARVRKRAALAPAQASA